MTERATVLDQPWQIELASLLALRYALKLEGLGMKRRGRSALSIARKRYATNAQRARCMELVNDEIREKEQAAGIDPR